MLLWCEYVLEFSIVLKLAKNGRKQTIPGFWHFPGFWILLEQARKRASKFQKSGRNDVITQGLSRIKYHNSGLEFQTLEESLDRFHLKTTDNQIHINKPPNMTIDLLANQTSYKTPDWEEYHSHNMDNNPVLIYP